MYMNSSKDDCHNKIKITHLSYFFIFFLLIRSNWKLIQQQCREIDKELMKGKRESLKAIKREVMMKMASVADREREREREREIEGERGGERDRGDETDSREAGVTPTLS